MRAKGFLIVVLMLVVAACGGGDGDAADGVTATTLEASNPGDGGTAAPTDTSETSPTSAAPGSGEANFSDARPAQMPDTSEMASTDNGPGFDWILVQGLATATAGGNTVEFSGLDPIWGTDQSPRGEPESFDTVASCTLFESAEGEILAQASFHHRTDRNLHSSFSMSDNGDGTVIWGLYNAETGEEWSATGPGSARIKYAKITGSAGWDDPFWWEQLGWYPDPPDHVYVIIDFDGPASENLSTDKSQASSRVLCVFATRP